YTLIVELPTLATQAQIKDEWAKGLLETVHQKRKEELEQIKEHVKQQVTQYAKQSWWWSIDISRYSPTARKAICNLLNANGFKAKERTPYSSEFQGDSYTLIVELPTLEAQDQTKDEWAQQLLATVWQKRQEELEEIKKYVGVQVTQRAGQLGWSIDITRRYSPTGQEAIRDLLQKNGFEAGISRGYDDGRYYGQLILKLPTLATQAQIKDEWAKGLLETVHEKRKEELERIKEHVQQQVTQRAGQREWSIDITRRYSPAGQEAIRDLLQKNGFVTRILWNPSTGHDELSLALPTLATQAQIKDEWAKGLLTIVYQAREKELKPILDEYLNAQIKRLEEEKAKDSPKYRILHQAKETINKPDVDLLTIKEQVKEIKEAVKEHRITKGVTAFFNKKLDINSKSYDEFIKVLELYPELVFEEPTGLSDMVPNKIQEQLNESSDKIFPL
ncbi:MAG: hypothetical protein WBE18_02630, partial [Gammaproteobacteria bacterium]